MVTDGMNVYYIMKPNDKDACVEDKEIIVNIPIRGSNIVKETGDNFSNRKKPGEGKLYIIHTITTTMSEVS